MDVLSFVITGHIDHGKSTLIGRLLYDTNSLPSDRIEELKKASADYGRRTEFAYLLDHLEEERKQGITIDTTQVFFKTDKRRYVIIDAPGHVEFVKNMITGASQAEAAVLIVDVAEGVREQTKRHSYMLAMLGLDQVIVALNKMDLAGYAQQHFDLVKDQISQWLTSIGIKPQLYIPISASNGENITTHSEKMPWYTGPTFLQSLDQLKNKLPLDAKSLILPIQDVYRIDEKRINAGRIESGSISHGDTIKIMPTGQTTTVKSIETFLASPTQASAGQSIGLTTTDSVFLDRGNIICSPADPPVLSDNIHANIFWMSKKDLLKDQKLTLRCATQETSCRIKAIKKRIDSSTLHIVATDADIVKNLEVAEITIQTKKPVCIRNFNDVRELGRFVLVQDQNICAGGIITQTSGLV